MNIPQATTLTAIADTLIRVLGHRLTASDFALDQRQVAADHLDLVFRCGPRFVRISANFGAEQAPFALGCHLGEGNPAWPESDWNSVSLWRLADSQERGAGDGVYDSLAYTAEAGAAEFERLAEICGDALARYGADFLRGQLGPFWQLRAAINAARQPYRSVTQAADGSMQVAVDAQSELLRQRFSRVPE